MRNGSGISSPSGARAVGVLLCLLLSFATGCRPSQPPVVPVAGDVCRGWTECGHFVNRPLGSRADEPPEDIQCCQNNGQILWTIQNPNIRSFSTEYPMIRFQPGDEVRVSADGCVQPGSGTKALGSTWRQYASPTGVNAELYYFGLIQIPGATPGFYKVQSAMNASPLWIPTDIHRTLAPEDVTLKLGYEDNDYTDNGYWGRSGDPTSGSGRGGDGDGEGGQCRNKPNAFVQVFISNHNQPPPSFEKFLGYDLRWDRIDPNGLPLDPEFQTQRRQRRDSLNRYSDDPATRYRPFDFANPWGDPGTSESCRSRPRDGNPWQHDQNLFDWRNHGSTDVFPNPAAYVTALSPFADLLSQTEVGGILLRENVTFLSAGQRAALNAANLIPFTPIIPFNVGSSPDRSLGVNHPCTTTDPMVDHVYQKYGDDPSLRNMTIEAVSYNFGAPISSAPHVNLGDATVAGFLSMNEFSDLTEFGASCLLFGRECDFSLSVLPPNSGLRILQHDANPQYNDNNKNGEHYQPGVHAEFDIRQTIDRMEFYGRSLPWWIGSWWERFAHDSAPSRFSSNTDRMMYRRRTPDGPSPEIVGDTTRQRRMIDGKFGVITGKVDLDCAHNTECGQELHPAYSLFVHTNEDPNDDTWAFLLQNTANSGARSKKVFGLNLPADVNGRQRYRVFLPQPNAVGTPELVSRPFFGDRVEFNKFEAATQDGVRGVMVEFRIDPVAKSGKHDHYTSYAPHFGGNIWIRPKFDLFGNEAYLWPLDLEYGPLGFGELHFRWTANDAAAPGRALSENVRRIDAGPFHTCAIVPSDRAVGGRVRCWGNNRYGQLGDGTTRSREVPSTVVPALGSPMGPGAFLDGITQISAGGDCTGSTPDRCTVTGDDYRAHTCAVDVDQNVYCWGANDYGQLGDARFTAANSAVPRPVCESISSGRCIPLKAVQVAAGGEHICARRANGAVVCWGRNHRQQITRSGEPILRTPTAAVGRLNDSDEAVRDAIDLSAGAEHACAVARPAGKRTDAPKTDLPPHTVCWGANGDEQSLQTYEGYFADRIADNFLFYPKKVSAGWHHTGQIAPNSPYHAFGWSSIQTWGRNLEAQLGTDPLFSSYYKAKVTHRVQFIPFGEQEHGQGRDLSAGWTHTCAIDEQFRLYCWGSAVDYGVTPPSEVPHQVNLARSDLRTPQVLEVTTGLKHTCATVATSTAAGDLDWRRTQIVCWGDNATGQLGDGIRTNSSSGKPVMFIAGEVSRLPYGRLDTGANHTCAIVPDTDRNGGIVRCWGDNTFGELGNGTVGGDSPRPASPVVIDFVRVAPLVRVTQVSAGGETCPDALTDPEGKLVCKDPTSGISAHTCAVTTQGVGYCWGSNQYGQLGNPTIADRTGTAISIEDASFDPCPPGSETCTHRPDLVSQISAGSFHTCAVTRGQQLFCWGRNDQGQLGLRRSDGSLITGSPVRTPALVAAGVSQVAAGAMHTCAQLVAGGTKCWGASANGRLGGGDVPGVAGAGTTEGPEARTVRLAAGGRHSGRFDGGTGARAPVLQLWGGNQAQQLGVPAAGSQANAPVEVRLASRAPSATFSLGWTHSCLVDDALQLYCAGSGVALGDGTSTSNRPRLINPSLSLSGLSGVKLSELGVVEVGAGKSHTCAALRTMPGASPVDWRDTAIVCWGANDKGQLGDTTHTRRGTPVEVRFP